jgi:hypothetical protein
MAKNDKKSDALDPNQGLDMTELGALESELVSDQIGFPPYWNPAEGKKFVGKVIMRDERDPDFVRYNIEAAVRHQCQEGPSDEARPVVVEKGQTFNVSDYAALPLSDYYGQTVLVTAIRKVPIDGGKTVWKFELKTTSEGRAQAAQLRRARIEEGAKELPAGMADAE